MDIVVTADLTGQNASRAQAPESAARRGQPLGSDQHTGMADRELFSFNS